MQFTLVCHQDRARVSRAEVEQAVRVFRAVVASVDDHGVGFEAAAK
ncbi:hypothetical protein [Pseudonocardia endophytica]|uniref:Uncharacterized protein n=1 Tax=Pseudonocardia endophytica TaxID=401976 RepID=A0A4R1HFB9_PSEEN|nr:hypothetical protein [Pseudonocardia endophytica]TCK20834.1 hypothetical protein EV378_4798 [Pseudonocardia endophytica]